MRLELAAVQKYTGMQDQSTKEINYMICLCINKLFGLYQEQQWQALQSEEKENIKNNKIDIK